MQAPSRQQAVASSRYTNSSIAHKLQRIISTTASASAPRTGGDAGPYPGSVATPARRGVPVVEFRPHVFMAIGLGRSICVRSLFGRPANQS